MAAKRKATAKKTQGKKKASAKVKPERMATGAKAGGSRALAGAEAAKAIDAYVARQAPAVREIAEEVRRVVREAVPEAKEAVNPWGVAVWDYYGPFCLMMLSKAHASLGFTRGTALPDAAALLEGTGKNMRHVKLKNADEARDPNVRELIVEAAALNQKEPMTEAMRTKN